MIHLFRTPEAHLVIDTYSGGIHILDALTYRALERMEENGFDPKKPESWETLCPLLLSDGFSEQAIAEGIEEIRCLIENEQLYTQDPYQDLALKLRGRKSYVKALCLNVAHTCNLDCDYCFASQGKYHGERALMSFEVAKAAIDFLIRSSGHHRNLDIDFFGGEPLLNWAVVKRTVEYARSLEQEHRKHFRFTFTTNGMLLREDVIEFLNREMHNVVLSLDGRPEVHDRLRHTVDGRGSYAQIVPKFQALVAARGEQEYYIRGTYTRNNIDFTEDVFHMSSLGFNRLSMEPVIGDPSEPYMLSEEDLPELLRQYDILASEMIRRNAVAADHVKNAGFMDALAQKDRPFVFYHFMLNLEGGPCIHKRISGCGSGTEYLAVTPTGELYPCHQFVGDEGFAVGTVWDGIQKTDTVESFQECNCYSHPECQDCWAKLYCSGGCSANALHASGSITGVVPFSCDLFRKRMECAIRIQVADFLHRSESENTVVASEG